MQEDRSLGSIPADISLH